MLTEYQARPEADGLQSRDDSPIVMESWTGPAMAIDESIDWSRRSRLDAPSIPPDCQDPSSGGAHRLFDAAQYDEDSMLDWWLASLTPDQFEHIFDCIASLQGGSRYALESSA